MKYLFLVALMGMSSAMAFANTNVNNDDKDIRFECRFRSHAKKGLTCEVRGEASILLGDDHDGRRDRDDRLFVRCNDGYTDEERAFAKFDGSDLVIKGRDQDDLNQRGNRIVVSDFHPGNDDSFRARLWSDDPNADRLFGSCRISFEHEEH